MENALQKVIFKETIEILYQNLTLGLSGILLQASVLLCLLFGHIPTNYLLTWYIILTLNLIGGFFVIAWYRRTKNNLNFLQYHYYSYVVGSSITALMFGIIGSVLMPSDIFYQTLIMINIIGITGAAVQNLHVSYFASLCYLTLSLLPLLVWQYLQVIRGESAFIGIFIATLTYCLYLVIDVRTGNNTLINNIKLKLENIHLSFHDALTGLYNRHYLDEILNKLLAQAKRDKRALSFILFDIDKFKAINDSFGHEAGDLVLKNISELTRKFFRGTDYIFRYGGEEFLILLPNVDYQETIRITQAFIDYIRELSIPIASNDVISLTISAGVSSYPGKGLLAADLIKAADQALYEAKNNGRNRVS